MPTKPLPDEELRRTLDVVESVNGNISQAAKILGIKNNPVRNRMMRAQERGILSTSNQLRILHGVSPDPRHDLVKQVPAPLILRGTSTNYDADGNVIQQWVKTKLDDRKVDEAMRAAIEGLMAEVPKAKPSKPPKEVNDRLLNLITITDYHVGMYSWAQETGGDWDLTIAEQMAQQAFSRLIDSMPAAKVGFVNQLGDYMHFDSLIAETPTHRNPLDADGRFGKVVKVAVRILRHIIDLALQKHEKVVVLIAEGNHDLASSVWLRHLFALLFEDDPRVHVIESELPYYCYQHGSSMLSFHHGHMRKPEQLPSLFAAQYPGVWGSTQRRYCHSGHQHHLLVREMSGMTVTQHPTLAPRDSHSARHGYQAERRLIGITYHDRFGEVEQTTVNPDMFVEEAA
jgi:hypothetical protein